MQRSNKESLRIFFDAAKANDSEQMLAVLHPNVQVIEAESLPYGCGMQGRENFTEFSTNVFKTWRNTSVTVEELIGDGQYVVVLATCLERARPPASHLVCPLLKFGDLTLAVS